MLFWVKRMASSDLGKKESKCKRGSNSRLGLGARLIGTPDVNLREAYRHKPYWVCTVRASDQYSGSVAIRKSPDQGDASVSSRNDHRPYPTTVENITSSYFPLSLEFERQSVCIASRRENDDRPEGTRMHPAPESWTLKGALGRYGKGSLDGDPGIKSTHRR